MKFLRRHWFALLAVAAALIRLPRPAAWWYDEAFTVWITRLPWPRMVEATLGDVHPPLFYVLEWMIMRLPVTETALRLIPAAASFAGLLALRRIARRLDVPEPAQVVGLVIMAVSGWQMYYAQEARSYSLIQLAYLVGVVAIIERRWWALFVSFAALLYLHNYGLIYCAVLGLWAVAAELRRPVHACVDLPWFPVRQLEADVRAPILAGAGAIALYAPWFVWGTLPQMGEFTDHWIWPPTPADVLATLLGFMFGQTDSVMWTLIVAVAGIALIWWVGYRVFSDRERPLLLVYLAAAPFVLAVGLSYVWEPLFLGRALIGAAGPFYLLVGWALTHRVPAVSRAWAACLLIPVLVLTSPGDSMRERAAHRFEAEAVSQYIADHWQAGDVVYHLNVYSLVEMSQYLGEHTGYMLPVDGDGLKSGGLTLRTRVAMGIHPHEEPLEAVDYRRAWLIVIEGPGLDQTPARDAILSRTPHRRELRLTDRMGYNHVEVYLLWRESSDAR